MDTSFAGVLPMGPHCVLFQSVPLLILVHEQGKQVNILAQSILGVQYLLTREPFKL